MDRPLLSNEDGHPRLQRLMRNLGLALTALSVLFGVGCFAVAASPQVISIDAANGDLHWRPSTCEVLAAGMAYVGSCDHDSRVDVNNGQYSHCGPYLLCANEGPNETCDCSGTVRFGTYGLDALESRTVEQDVSGSIGCNTGESGFNNTDPAPFFNKQCWCRPDRLSSIVPESVAPPACAEISSLDGWVPDTNGSACQDAYLSWALVTVIGSEVNATRCAYEYGSPPMSWKSHGDSAKQYLDGTLSVNVGRTLECSVLSNPPGEKELGALEECVVGFSPDTNESIAWATQWQSQVEFRFSMCWTALGLGFFIVAPLLAIRFKLVAQD